MPAINPGSGFHRDDHPSLGVRIAAMINSQQDMELVYGDSNENFPNRQSCFYPLMKAVPERSNVNVRKLLELEGYGHRNVEPPVGLAEGASS
jgi:hypothetical protein